MGADEFIKEIWFLVKQCDRAHIGMEGIEQEARRLYLAVYTKGFDDGKQSQQTKMKPLALTFHNMTGATQQLLDALRAVNLALTEVMPTE